MTNRYNTTGLDEGEFQAGSNGLVLKNLKQFTRISDIENFESVSLADLNYKVFTMYSATHRFTEKDICTLHRLWLEELYSWAGQYRTVNMSKGNFLFASAHLVPSLMKDFEKNILSKYTPCNFTQIDQVLDTLAIVHTEFILIHPFREGNGRLGRLLVGIMAAQANYGAINFEQINHADMRENYFAAVRSGLERNYAPMKDIIKKILLAKQ